MNKSVSSTYRSLYKTACLWLALIALLIIIGFIFIYSASCVYALEKLHNPYFFVQKQIAGFCCGLLVSLCVFCLPTYVIEKLAYIIFSCALGVTALTVCSSYVQHIHGSTRWLKIGPITLQPSEFLKFALIIACSKFLTKHEGTFKKNKKLYGYYILLIIVPSFILLLQPDFGMACTMSITAALLFFVIEFNVIHVITILLATSALVTILITCFPYRLRRIMIFLNPWSDPQGAGFQIIQSLIAIGSGGLWGVGIGSSKQKFFYLPMQHTDFIFAIIAEEIGFVGSVTLLMLYCLFTYFGIMIALRIRNKFNRYAFLGFVVITTLQTLINLAVNVGLAPTKGIGLPFVSSGSSALISSLIYIGFLAKVIREELQTQHTNSGRYAVKDPIFLQ